MPLQHFYHSVDNEMYSFASQSINMYFCFFLQIAYVDVDEAHSV